MSRKRSEIVAQAQSWIGCKEADGSHKKIIDLYNNHNGSPRAEFFTDEDRRAMRIRIPIHPAFLEADDEISLSDNYEKATKKLSKKKIEQYDKIIKLLNDGEWHKTAEIAGNLGLKDTRTKELLKELIVLDKLIDNGKTKGKLYRLK